MYTATARPQLLSARLAELARFILHLLQTRRRTYVTPTRPARVAVTQTAADLTDRCTRPAHPINIADRQAEPPHDVIHSPPSVVAISSGGPGTSALVLPHPGVSLVTSVSLPGSNRA